VLWCDYGDLACTSRKSSEEEKEKELKGFKKENLIDILVCENLMLIASLFGFFFLQQMKRGIINKSYLHQK